MLSGDFEVTIPDGYCCFPNSDGESKFYAAGTSYRLKECHKAFASMPDRIWLVRDPGNSYDPNAVKIMIKRGWHTYHVGFIPAKESPAVSQLLKQRVTPIIQITKVESDPRNLLFVFVLLVPNSVYLKKNPYAKKDIGKPQQGKHHSGCLWGLLILLLLISLPIIMANCETHSDKSDAPSATIQKPKPKSAPQAPHSAPVKLASASASQKVENAKTAKKQFLAEIESSVRKKFPFKNIQKGMTVSFVADNKETVSGKVVRVSEKGVLIAKTDGWTMLYDKKHLALKAKALFYKDDYEKFIEQGIIYYTTHIDTLTTKSGKTYQNCTIEKPTPYGLAITHECGGVTIPYSDLPGLWRKRYHENELRAPAERKKLEAHRAQILKEEAEEKFQTSLKNTKETLAGYKVFQIVDSGLLLSKGDRIIYVSGISPGDLTTGDYLKAFDAWEVGTSTYPTPIGTTNSVHHYTVDTAEATVYYRLHPEKLMSKNK